MPINPNYLRVTYKQKRYFAIDNHFIDIIITNPNKHSVILAYASMRTSYSNYSTTQHQFLHYTVHYHLQLVFLETVDRPSPIAAFHLSSSLSVTYKTPRVVAARHQNARDACSAFSNKLNPSTSTAAAAVSSSCCCSCIAASFSPSLFPLLLSGPLLSSLFFILFFSNS